VKGYRGELPVGPKSEERRNEGSQRQGTGKLHAGILRRVGPKQRGEGAGGYREVRSRSVKKGAFRIRGKTTLRSKGERRRGLLFKARARIRREKRKSGMRHDQEENPTRVGGEEKRQPPQKKKKKKKRKKKKQGKFRSLTKRQKC